MTSAWSGYSSLLFVGTVSWRISARGTLFSARPHLSTGHHAWRKWFLYCQQSLYFVARDAAVICIATPLESFKTDGDDHPEGPCRHESSCHESGSPIDREFRFLQLLVERRTSNLVCRGIFSGTHTIMTIRTITNEVGRKQPRSITKIPPLGRKTARGISQIKGRTVSIGYF